MNPWPVLEQYAEIFRPTQLNLLSPGGLSGARIWRLFTPAGEMCLRQWPVEHPAPQRLTWIHQVLCAAKQAGLQFLPVPMRAADGRTFVSAEGHLWELAPWMPGTAVEPEAATSAHVAAAMAALAAFHNATAGWVGEADRGVSPPAVEERWQRIEHWLHQGGIDVMQRESVEAELWLAERAVLLIAAFRRWAPGVELDLHAARKRCAILQPCIRDVHDQHVLFRNDQPERPSVSGLIDFGAMRMDTVATDIARLLGTLAADNVELWEAGQAAYQRQRPLSAGEWKLAGLIDRANVVLTGPQWLHWLLVERKQFASVPAILARLDRVLKRLKNLEQPSAVERRN